MTFRASIAFVTVSLLPAVAARHKLNIDPETREGFTLQQIKQERNEAKKLEMMAQFLEDYPKDENIPWVIENLLPSYEEKKAWEKLLAAGDRLLAVDPSDYQTAFACLRAAEAIDTPDAKRKYASIAWKTADLVTEAAKPKDSGEVAAWQKDAEQARNLKLYAEYTVFSLTKADASRKDEYVEALEQLNPRSVYLIAARQGEQRANMTIPALLEGLDKEPNNVDFLAVLADQFIRQSDLPKAAAFSGRLIEVFGSNLKPDNMTPAEWSSKRDRYFGNALWMNGMLSSVLGDYPQADRSLRAALPFVRASNPGNLVNALYNLGYVNYKLAQKGEAGRVFEAIRFNQECAAYKGPLQEQATKNIAAIKAEYSIQ